MPPPANHQAVSLEEFVSVVERLISIAERLYLSWLPINEFTTHGPTPFDQPVQFRLTVSTETSLKTMVTVSLAVV
jgi:hypothetical protein